MVVLNLSSFFVFFFMHILSWFYTVPFDSVNINESIISELRIFLKK